MLKKVCTMHKWRGVTILAVVFCVIVLSPFMVNIGNAQTAPVIKIDTPTIDAKGATQCILPTEDIKSTHMQMLETWRNAVVRDGQVSCTNKDGQVMDMSLDDTCLACHSNRQEFCDACHEYVNVEPYCWECHDGSKK